MQPLEAGYGCASVRSDLERMSKPAIASAAVGVSLGIAGLLSAAQADDGAAKSADSAESTDAAELEQPTSRYTRGWRLAVAQQLLEGRQDDGGQPPDAVAFAPEFDLDDGHVWVTSVAFGEDRFFALDIGRTWVAGWPCDEACYARLADRPPPRVRAYTTTGDLDASLDFEPYEYDAADHVVAIVYAAGKLYVMNRNPPKVYVYMPDGRRVVEEDFYLAGGERYREDGHDSDMSRLPVDFVHAAGRFYVLDQGSNQYAPKVWVYDSAGARIREAEFQIDGLRFEGCGSGDDSCEWPESIVHADGTLYVKVWLRVPGWPTVDHPIWLYALDGSRAGTLHFDDSALFTDGMTHANGWFYLLSDYSSTEPYRVCAYTLQGQRVAPNAEGAGMYC